MPPATWVCPPCAYVNAWDFRECAICSLPKGVGGEWVCEVCGSPGVGDGPCALCPISIASTADWTCAVCEGGNPAGMLQCIACTLAREGADSTAGWTCDGCTLRVAATCAVCGGCGHRNASVPAPPSALPSAPAAAAQEEAAAAQEEAAAPEEDDGWTTVPSKKDKKKKQQPLRPTAATFEPGAGAGAATGPEEAGGLGAEIEAALRGAQIVLLCGYPGSGKSTLCKGLRRWAVINQDTLGSRHRCEGEAVQAVREGRRVIIDRCNHDASQRATWTGIARRASVPDQRVVAVWLQVPTKECERRVMSRRGHPTLPPTNASRGIVRNFAAMFQAPQEGEPGIGLVVRVRAEQVPAVVAALGSG